MAKAGPCGRSRPCPGKFCGGQAHQCRRTQCAQGPAFPHPVLRPRDTRRVLFATPGRDHKTFAAFAEDLKTQGGDAGVITDVSLDLGKAYQRGTRGQCPNARISFDPFHVIALAHEALDQVRRAEVKHEPDLKDLRWGTLKDAAHWTHKQINAMHWLQRSGLKTARAWRLKERLRDLFAAHADVPTTQLALIHWISWARRCRLAPFKRLGATVKANLAGILRHFETGLNNGLAESINGRIQAAKARARGYATDRLIHHAHIIELTGESYRKRAHAKQSKKEATTTPT